MKTSNFSSREKYIYALLACLVWLYVALRGIFVPITFDEVATFFHYVQTGAIFPGPKTLWDANNHVFNTLLTHLSYRLFGEQEWALRLPAILVSLLYFIYTFKIAGLLKNIRLRWAMVFGFLFGHFLIEFFAFTRGYGMSIAILVPSLYYQLIFFKKGENKHLIAGLFLAALAVWANLTLVISFLIIQAFVLLKSLIDFKDRKVFISRIIILSLSGIGPSLYFIWYGFQLKARGLLYYGETDGFWQITVKSLLKYFTFEGNFMGEIIIAALFGLLLVAQLIKLKGIKLQDIYSSDRFFSSLFLGNISASLLMNWLLDSNFAEDRVGIFYYPFFILSLCFSLDVLNVKFKKPLVWVPLIILSFFPLHFVYTLNLKYSSLWDFDASMQEFYQVLMEDSSSGEHNPTISGYHLRGFPYFFENIKYGSPLNPIMDNRYVGGVADYQIVSKAQCNSCEQYHSIAYNEISDSHLMKRNKPATSFPIDSTIMGNKGISNDEFQTLYVNQGVDSLVGKNLRVDINMTIHAPEMLRSWIIYQVTDANSKKLIYHFYCLNWLRSEWVSPHAFNASLPILIPEGSQEFAVYMWNLYQQEYEFRGGELVVSEYLND